MVYLVLSNHHRTPPSTTVIVMAHNTESFLPLYTVNTTNDIESILSSPENPHVLQLELGAARKRAQHSRHALLCSPQAIAQVLEKLPSVGVEDIRVGDNEWQPLQLTVSTPSSASASSWLASFTQPPTAPIQSGTPHPAVFHVVIPSGLFVAASPATRLVQCDIHVIELSHDLPVTTQAARIGLASQQLAFYHGGAWGHLVALGEVIDRMGSQIRCLSLCWINVDKIEWHDVPTACELLKLPKCTALRSLAIWIPLGKARRGVVHWRMATESLAAAKHTPLEHVQLVLDASEADPMSVFEEFKQARWADMKNSLSDLGALKTISIANTAEGGAFKEELFGIAMAHLEELRREDIRIVESKGPLFTVSNCTTAPD